MVFCLTSAIAANDLEVVVYVWKCSQCNAAYITNVDKYPDNVDKCENGNNHTWILKKIHKRAVKKDNNPS